MKNTYFYAVLTDNDDADWSYGSYDLDEAEKMVSTMKENDYPDAYIAVIEMGNDPICVDTIGQNI